MSCQRYSRSRADNGGYTQHPQAARELLPLIEVADELYAALVRCENQLQRTVDMDRALGEVISEGDLRALAEARAVLAKVQP